MNVFEAYQHLRHRPSGLSNAELEDMLQVLQRERKARVFTFWLPKKSRISNRIMQAHFRPFADGRTLERCFDDTVKAVYSTNEVYLCPPKTLHRNVRKDGKMVEWTRVPVAGEEYHAMPWTDTGKSVGQALADREIFERQVQENIAWQQRIIGPPGHRIGEDVES